MQPPSRLIGGTPIERIPIFNAGRKASPSILTLEVDGLALDGLCVMGSTRSIIVMPSRTKNNFSNNLFPMHESYGVMPLGYRVGNPGIGSISSGILLIMACPNTVMCVRILITSICLEVESCHPTGHINDTHRSSGRLQENRPRRRGVFTSTLGRSPWATWSIP